MNKTWWKEAVVYQVYPRSFMDSNGDGIGDIPGIFSRLDHIKSLGVDVIWLSPVYKSPNDDNGYDISDYYAIMEEFGTMADFDRLLEGIHQRGMKLLMDLVVNHSSDEHAWFEESRASKDSTKRDYYIWRPGKNGGPPNNWQSFFGGDAWLLDERTGEYYLHLFTRKQPDLNWENPTVRQEVYQIMKFWLDKGIDGFRMDVISLISKRGFEDTPYADFGKTIEKIYANGPKIHEYLKEMNQEVLRKYDVMTVGEGPGIDLENSINYVAEAEKELNMIFHFDHMFIDHGPEGKFDPVPYDLVRFKEVFTLWDERLKNDGWGSIFLGNHDFPRIVSRFANDGPYREESAKLLALLLMTLRGTPYIYQGEELGMTNVAFDRIEEYDDIETKNVYREWKSAGKDLNKLMQAIHKQGRDNARTPMHWDNTTNGGFTSGTPWLGINPNYPKINAALQEKDVGSVLNFYRKMVQVRKANPTLVYGDYEVVQPDHASVYAYWRWDEGEKFLVLLNFSDESRPFAFVPKFQGNMVPVIGNYQQTAPIANGEVLLKPWEATLFRMEGGF